MTWDDSDLCRSTSVVASYGCEAVSEFSRGVLQLRLDLCERSMLHLIEIDVVLRRAVLPVQRHRAVNLSDFHGWLGERPQMIQRNEVIQESIMVSKNNSKSIRFLRHFKLSSLHRCYLHSHSSPPQQRPPVFPSESTSLDAKCSGQRQPVRKAHCPDQ